MRAGSTSGYRYANEQRFPPVCFCEIVPTPKGRFVDINSVRLGVLEAGAGGSPPDDVVVLARPRHTRSHRRPGRPARRRGVEQADPVQYTMRPERAREVAAGPYRQEWIDDAEHWLQQDSPDEVNPRFCGVPCHLPVGSADLYRACSTAQFSA
jgi:hypothetical protein